MGSPVRGIDVKLGKNPGGSVAARVTTDAAGNFILPLVPAGSYTLTFDIPKDVEVEVSVKGAVGGPTTQRISSTAQSAAKTAAPAATITVQSDGKNPLTGICQTAIIRSKSNICNN
jgi:hypothetical protein